MPVSNKIRSFMQQGSWIRKMFEEGIVLKQKYGAENVFDLSLGNPIMEPPPQFATELRRLADSNLAGLHRYMPNAGYADTRAAVAGQLAKETGLNFTGEHIVMTVGAGGAINVVMRTVLDPGDEIVIFAPYFVEYMFYADNHASTCKVVPCDDKFIPDFTALEKAIGPKTKIVLTSSPNNPTGVIYPAETLAKMGEVIRRKEAQYGTEIYLLSDEPYRKIIFDGKTYPQIFPHHVRSIVATSHSKDLALPGERIGFIAVSPGCSDLAELMGGLVFSNRTLGFVNAPALMQHIVKKLQDVTVDVSQYEKKRDFLYKNLTEIGYAVVRPGGAFYMFPKAPIDDDVAFVDELRKERVLVVPGRGFGMPGHFRIAYCTDDRTLQGAIPGFKKAWDAVKG